MSGPFIMRPNPSVGFTPHRLTVYQFRLNELQPEYDRDGHAYEFAIEDDETLFMATALYAGANRVKQYQAAHYYN